MGHESKVCRDCYQNTICMRRNMPQYHTVSGDEINASPQACIFHCCLAGILSAIKVVNANRNDASNSIFPFGTHHKPFIKDFGRYVSVRDAGGLSRGDVVVFIGEKRERVTNVFTYRPQR